MAITFVAYSESDSAGATALSPAIPTGTTTDDLMLAMCFVGDSTLPDGVWDDDGGGGNSWTKLIENYSTTGRSAAGAIFYKKATSGSESTPTFTYDATSRTMGAMIMTLRGVDTTTPFDVTYANGSHYVFTENQKSPTAAAITTATNGAWVVIAAGMTHNLDTWGAPSGYTIRNGTLIANNRTMSFATKEVTTAGVETPGAFSNTDAVNDNESQVYTLAIRPAGTGRPRHTYEWHFVNQGIINPSMR